MATLAPQDWTQYWDIGTTTTFISHGDKNYDGAVLDFWAAQIGPGDKTIVDLACGNGALVWLIDEILKKRAIGDYSVIGVDFADIAPFKFGKRKKANHPNVSFIGNTSVEAMPLEDHSVDLFVSQFGVEYADLSKVVAEIDRVLKPGGKLAFIMHDEKSGILCESRPKIAVVNYLLEEERIQDSLFALDKLYNDAVSMQALRQSVDFENLWASVGRIKYLATLKYDQWVAQEFGSNIKFKCDVLEGFLTAVSRVLSPQKLNKNKKRADAIAYEVNYLRTIARRLEDLATSALDEADLGRLRSDLEGRGYTVTQCNKMAYERYTNYGNQFVAIKSSC